MHPQEQLELAIAAGTTAIGGIAGAAATGAATSLGIEAATAAAVGTITAGGTTTALNVGMIEAIENGKSLITDD